MPGRAKGTANDVFEPDALIEALKPHARDKECLFDWELGDYGKSRRSQGPDREGLGYYAVLLAVVLLFAPHGYPSSTLLKIVWRELQHKYSIMSKELIQIYGSKLDAWTSLCAEKVRLACRHIVDLKRSQTTYVSSEVRALIDLVKLRDDAAPAASRRTSSSSKAPPPGAPTGIIPPRSASSITTQRRASSKCAVVSSDSEAVSSQPSSEVMCCGANCQCPDCQKATVVESSQECGSEGSAAAQNNTEHVPADRGGQKRAAQPEDPEEDKSTRKRPAAAEGETSRKKPAAAGEVRLSIVSRHQPIGKRESYIMKNGKFLIGCSEKTHAAYLQIVDKLKKEIEGGTVAAEKDACKARMAALKREF